MEIETQYPHKIFAEGAVPSSTLNFQCKNTLVVQLDRTSDYESECRKFESYRECVGRLAEWFKAIDLKSIEA